MNDREQLQELNLAVEGALEQLARAHGLAAGTPPAPELATIGQLLGDLSVLRNQVRERLMKELSKPPRPSPSPDGAWRGEPSAPTMTILK